MCHGVRVNLSPEERVYARRLTGMMIPVYAVVILAVIALATLTGGQRSGELVASSAPPAAVAR